MGPKEVIIKAYASDIEDILAGWGFVKDSTEWDIKQSEVKIWLENFEPSEIPYAIKIIENIQYYTDSKIRRIISNLSQKINTLFDDELTNVLFFPLGNSLSASGGMYMYQYRKELKLNEINFAGDFKDCLSKQCNIVFFDDIIGSGRQAVKFFNQYLKNAPGQYYYFAVLGFENGLSHIRLNTKFKQVIAGIELSDESRAFTEESQVFNGEEQRVIRPICEKYGRILFKQHPLGYDDSQALIVFPHNTPNNTLPIIWAGNNNETRFSEKLWSPLFERKKLKTEKPKKSLKQIEGAFCFNRDSIIKKALSFVKEDFCLNKSSRRFEVAGKSGTGKTYLIKTILSNLYAEDNILYVDLNSDGFFINLFFEFLIYNSLNGSKKDAISRIENENSFLFFLENNCISNKKDLIDSLYTVIKQLPGMSSLEKSTYTKNDTSINSLDYFIKYLEWITCKKRFYLVVDNYQFLTNAIKTVTTQVSKVGMILLLTVQEQQELHYI